MKLNIKEICVFGVLGALMYASKVIMDFLPNIHLLGTLIIAFTIVYRKKALYPIYVFVLLTGIFSGFAIWWIPYLYIWAILWGGAMLIPRNLKTGVKMIVYPLLCALHGLLYGTLYAPAQALLFSLDFKGMIAWIIAGFPYDIIHAVSNLFCGLLILPLSKALSMAEKYSDT